jgi:hypothetical protein
MLNEIILTSYFLKDQRSEKRFVRLLCIRMPRSHGMTHPSSSRPYILVGRSVPRVGSSHLPGGEDILCRLTTPATDVSSQYIYRALKTIEIN